MTFRTSTQARQENLLVVGVVLLALVATPFFIVAALALLVAVGGLLLLTTVGVPTRELPQTEEELEKFLHFAP